MEAVMTIQYKKNTYYDYESMMTLLSSWAETYPQLVKLVEFGESLEGRKLIAVELTHYEHGLAEDKPGFYIDANLHAGEVSGSAVALYTINHLLQSYGKDDYVTHLLNTRTFYIIPRISVDGAEVYLKTPQTIRSSTKIRPFFEEEEGIIPEDLTGNGHITMMRVKNPNGEWKISDKDARVMIRRGPADWQGDFFSIYPEGRIKDYDQLDGVKLAKSKYYLDINRNFPTDWVPTDASGDFPLSEPETRALAEYIIARPNITGVISYHTFSGIILRPSAMKRDDQLPLEDVQTMKALAKRGEALTGYPSVPVYEGFNYHSPPKPLPGSFLEWNYEHLGLYSFTTELWDVAKAAGIEKKPNEYARFWLALSEEDHITLLKYFDQQHQGEGFFDWETIQHPQLGEVEIGGWSIKYTLQNPPPQLLEAECKGNMLFSLEHAAAAPCLEITGTEIKQLAQYVFKITVEIENTGFLPTYLSQKAKEKNQVREITAHLIDDNVTFIEGKRRQRLGHLDGYGKMPELTYLASVDCQNKTKVSWIIETELEEIIVKITSTKAGNLTKKLSLS